MIFLCLFIWCVNGNKLEAEGNGAVLVISIVEFVGEFGIALAMLDKAGYL